MQCTEVMVCTEMVMYRSGPNPLWCRHTRRKAEQLRYNGPPLGTVFGAPVIFDPMEPYVSSLPIG